MLVWSTLARPQEAYETLSDPAKRREFDSTDDVDDSLPTSCPPADFYKVRCRLTSWLLGAFVWAGDCWRQLGWRCRHALFLVTRRILSF